MTGEYEISFQYYEDLIVKKSMLRTIRVFTKKIDIENTIGQNVYSSIIANRQSEFKIDISHFANGIYFVKTATEKGVVIKKFVKE